MSFARDGEGRGPTSSSEVFHGGLIRVLVEDRDSGTREVVRHPGACAVVALTPSNDVILVRQFREAVRRSLLEIPAGIADVPGETAAGCAARELLEETGHRATAVEPLGPILTSPGFADERIDLFLAAASAGPVAPPVEDGMETILLPFAEALAAVDAGRIQDAKTVAALLRAARVPGVRDAGDRPGILYPSEGPSRAEPDEGDDAP